MSAPDLNDLHMLVLAWFRSHDGYPEDAATALKLPVAVVAALCAELEAAGYIEAPAVHCNTRHTAADLAAAGL